MSHDASVTTIIYGLKQGDPSALPTVKRQVASLLGTEGAHG